MRIISRGTLRDFWATHADTEQALRAWFHEDSEASWPTPKAIKQAFPAADILPDNRIVLNIKAITTGSSSKSITTQASSSSA